MDRLECGGWIRRLVLPEPDGAVGGEGSDQGLELSGEALIVLLIGEEAGDVVDDGAGGQVAAFVIGLFAAFEKVGDRFDREGGEVEPGLKSVNEQGLAFENGVVAPGGALGGGEERKE